MATGTRNTPSFWPRVFEVGPHLPQPRQKSWERGLRASLRKGRGPASPEKQLLSFVTDRQPSLHTKTQPCHHSALSPPVWSLDFPPEFVGRPFLQTHPGTPHRWFGQLLQWGARLSPPSVEAVLYGGQEASASGLDSIPSQCFLGNLKILAHSIYVAFANPSLTVYI